MHASGVDRPSRSKSGAVEIGLRLVAIIVKMEIGLRLVAITVKMEIGLRLAAITGEMEIGRGGGSPCGKRSAPLSPLALLPCVGGGIGWVGLALQP